MTWPGAGAETTPPAAAAAPDEAGDMPIAPLLLGGKGGAPLVRLFVDEPCDEALIPVD